MSPLEPKSTKVGVCKFSNYPKPISFWQHLMQSQFSLQSLKLPQLGRLIPRPRSISWRGEKTLQKNNSPPHYKKWLRLVQNSFQSLLIFTLRRSENKRGKHSVSAFSLNCSSIFSLSFIFPNTICVLSLSSLSRLPSVFSGLPESLCHPLWSAFSALLDQLSLLCRDSLLGLASPLAGRSPITEATPWPKPINCGSATGRSTH